MDKIDLSNLMLETEKLKEEFDRNQDKIHKMKATGESGAGLVKIVINGTHDVLSTHLDDTIFEQKKNIIEELITAAANDAINKINQQTKSNITDFSKLFNLPK